MNNLRWQYEELEQEFYHFVQLNEEKDQTINLLSQEKRDLEEQNKRRESEGNMGLRRQVD